MNQLNETNQQNETNKCTKQIHRTKLLVMRVLVQSPALQSGGKYLQRNIHESWCSQGSDLTPKAELSSFKTNRWLEG